MPNEADTCRKFVVPKLQAAGWDTDPHSIAEQRTFTDGRIIVRGNKTERRNPKRAISVNFDDRTLTVLTNDGSGQFVLACSLSVGLGPRSVVATDVNGDGKVDLVCGNGNDNNLMVFTNSGSGGFVLASVPETGSGFGYVWATDLNGDGKPDLIAADFYSDSLTVLTNNGSGGFVQSSAPSVGSGPVAVASADLNGDGMSRPFRAERFVWGRLPGASPQAFTLRPFGPPIGFCNISLLASSRYR